MNKLETVQVQVMTNGTYEVEKDSYLIMRNGIIEKQESPEDKRRERGVRMAKIYKRTVREAKRKGFYGTKTMRLMNEVLKNEGE